MKLVRRGYFGWGPTDASPANPTEGLCLHYDGPGSSLTQKRHSQCVSYWKAVRKFHMQTNGWADIGYSYGVCPHAYVFEGRGARRVQAAQPGGNSTFYSCTLMTGDGERPTNIQIEAVKEFRLWLMKTYGVAATVKGHKDFFPTSCPGGIIYGMIRDGVFSTVPANVYPLDNPLRLGDHGGGTGTMIKRVQRRLNELGYKPLLEIDGWYGPATVKAVEWFQKKNKLTVDGLVGKETWKKLFS